MIKTYTTYILALATVLLSSCKEKTQSTATETFEIYSTVGDSQSKAKDSLKYFESTEYQAGKAQNTSYFDHKGSLTGKQVFAYDANQTLTSSQYYDKLGKLLSSYKYVTDLDGKKIAAYAFDAKDQSLFRVETFEYADTLVKTKRIHDPDFSLYRKYDFTYDQYGNETGMKVFDGTGKLIIDEEFRIAARDKKNQWIEKWGFMNDQPVTYHLRRK